MKKFDTIKLVGMVGMALGGLATLIGNWAQEKAMEQTIEEKVNEALALREKETEEGSN